MEPAGVAIIAHTLTRRPLPHMKIHRKAGTPRSMETFCKERELSGMLGLSLRNAISGKELDMKINFHAK